jgi:hypothetical protein
MKHPLSWTRFFLAASMLAFGAAQTRVSRLEEFLGMGRQEPCKFDRQDDQNTLQSVNHDRNFDDDSLKLSPTWKCESIRPDFRATEKAKRSQKRG